jgi:hypothetical protein
MSLRAFGGNSEPWAVAVFTNLLLYAFVAPKAAKHEFLCRSSIFE